MEMIFGFRTHIFSLDLLCGAHIFPEIKSTEGLFQYFLLINKFIL